MTDERNSIPWLTGTTFAGRYEVGTLIARGGMAEVYHAVDVWSNNPVAVKVLLPHLSADPTQRQKFFREGNALSKIRHEHVVGVIQDGTQQVLGQDVMFLVLEYVHGCTLAQLMALRPVLSVGELLEVMLPVVEGLSEVHAHRLIHRDMKPANVLLEEGGSVKLSDFGLTRRADQSWTGELMGTPAYVAPEIMDPVAVVGAPADIFAVGVVMYRLLTGRLPFPGVGNDQQVLYHNVNSEIPSVALVAQGISPGVAGVVSWCTRRAVKDRPQDAAELFRALQDVRAELSDEELAYRAPVGDEPVSGLWEDVAAIAERSGMTRVYRSTPISAFGMADDLLAPEGPLSEHEVSVLAAAEVGQVVDGPLPLLGVGPLTQGQALAEAAEAETADGDATDWWDPAQEQDDSGQEPAPASGRGAGSGPISAGYNPRRAATFGVSEQVLPVEQASAGGRPDDPALWSESQRRVPAERWRPLPSPLALVLGFVAVTVGFVAAGFLGWWLAQFLV